ncbi:hypothetical protein HanIR_Chr11g0516321 [Helianthus annuus]|nr:hypothetical protein HanIR_Chr11g0516321 [Helianthus annuus]
MIVGCIRLVTGQLDICLSVLSLHNGLICQKKNRAPVKELSFTSGTKKKIKKKKKKKKG